MSEPVEPEQAPHLGGQRRELGRQERVVLQAQPLPVLGVGARNALQLRERRVHQHCVRRVRDLPACACQGKGHASQASTELCEQCWSTHVWEVACHRNSQNSEQCWRAHVWGRCMQQRSAQGKQAELEWHACKCGRTGSVSKPKLML